MAERDEGGSSGGVGPMGKWILGVAATLLTGTLLAGGAWLLNAAQDSKTDRVANTIILTNMDKTMTVLQKDQKDILSLLRGTATREELEGLRQDLQNEVEELRSRLAKVEAQVALLDDREKRKQ